MSYPFEFIEFDTLTKSERLQILSHEEYKLLWGRPRTSATNSEFFFALNRCEAEVLTRLRNSF